MKSLYCHLSLLYWSINQALSDCNVNTGPTGWVDCVYNSASKSFQFSACVTNNYVKEKTSNQQLCPNIANTQYCYIPCMAELGLSGVTVDPCRCAEGASIVQSTLPSDCLSFSQVDCSWYRRCLAGQYSCSGEANVAMFYGEKFCNVYNTPPPQVSRIALGWVDSVRQCFQVQLTPVLRSYGIQSSCNDLQQRISNTYSPCYSNNSAAISVCDLSCREFSYYFFALHSGYSNGYVAQIKDLYASMIQCSQSPSAGKNLCGIECDSFYLPSGGVNSVCTDAAMFELTFDSNSIGVGGIAEMIIEDQIAFKIIASLSSRFNWGSVSSVRWYPRVSPSLVLDEISIQLFMVDAAALGLISRGSLKSLPDVVRDLADSIKTGLTINLDGPPSIQLRAKSFHICNPYGQLLGACNAGQTIATASDVATVSAKSVSTSSFQPTSSTSVFRISRRGTPSPATPPRQANTPSKGFSRAGGTPPKVSTSAFSTTTIASSLTTSVTLSSTSSSSSNSFSGNDATRKGNTPEKSDSVTRRNVTPTPSGSAASRNMTPGFSRPTINP